MFSLTRLRRGVAPCQVALNGERLPTDVTCVWLQPTMAVTVILKVMLFDKRLLETSQVNGLTPLRRCLRLFRSCWRSNVFPQLSHLKSFSPVWVIGAFSGGSLVQTSYHSRHTCMGWLHEERNGDFSVRSVEQHFPVGNVPADGVQLCMDLHKQ